MELLVAFVVLLAETVMSSDGAQLCRLKVQRPIAVMARVNLVLLSLLSLIIGLIQVVNIQHFACGSQIGTIDGIRALNAGLSSEFRVLALDQEAFGLKYEVRVRLDTNTLTTTQIIFQIAVRRQHRVGGRLSTSFKQCGIIFDLVLVLICFAQSIGSGRLFSDLLDLLHGLKVVDFATCHLLEIEVQIFILLKDNYAFIKD